MSISFCSSPISQKETIKNKKDYIQYGLSASVPAIAGLTHGIYKKINNNLNTKITYLKHKPYVILKEAIALNPGSGDAISILENPHNEMLQRILIDNNVKIKDIPSRKHLPTNKFIHYLTELGFNPNNEKIMEFITNYGIDKLNKDIKDKFGIDFHIVFEKDKGRDKSIYKILLNEVEGSTPPKESKIVESETFFFKKILNPSDEKILNKIEKLPFGKNFANFMRKTNAPIERFKFKPLRKFYYDKTSMLKGASIASLLGISICATIKGVYTLAKKPKPSSEDSVS